MRTDDFDYTLPPELIAQEPSPRREDARLLVQGRATGATAHRRIPDLVEYLRAGDLLVVNDTRVLAARLFARRESGGGVEVLLVQPEEEIQPGAWSALLRAGGSLRPGEVLQLTDGESSIEGGVRLVDRLGPGEWLVEAVGADFPALMQRAGKMPLPPYIRRTRQDAREALDRERYQTVFAREEGAIAAPTAGLHLTDELLARIAERGVAKATVTLHVGIGTFRPIQSEVLEQHEMHEERYAIPKETADAVRSTRAAGGRVVAVGTTTVRALEASASKSRDHLPVAGARTTDLFITPGYEFRTVDALLTNFHLPRSTLLCLVSAFGGRERVLAAYREAVALRYRFYSYGDAMLVV